MDKELRGRRRAPIAPPPDPEPAVPTGPVPDPGPATPAIPPYCYNGPSDPAAYEASRGALQALGDARGVGALGELQQAVGVLDDEARRSTSDPARLRDILARRLVYAARAVALAGVLRVDAGIPGPPDVPSPDELEERSRSQSQAAAAVGEARRGLELADDEAETATFRLGDDDAYGRSNEGPSLQWAGNREILELGRTIRRRLAEVRGPADYALRPVASHEIEPDLRMLIVALGTQPNVRVPRGWHQDAALRSWDAAAEARRHALAGLERAEGRAARHRERIAGLVGAAVAKGGGKARVVDAVIAAQLLGTMPAELGDLVALVAEATEGHRRIAGDIDRLAGVGIDAGEAWDELHRSQADAMARLRGLRDDLAARHRELATSLVDSALAGDDRSRRELAALAQSQDRCFPRGFREAISG